MFRKERDHQQSAADLPGELFGKVQLLLRFPSSASMVSALTASHVPVHTKGGSPEPHKAPNGQLLRIQLCFGVSK
eukprot:1722312-Amphidinium_carterae.1